MEKFWKLIGKIEKTIMIFGMAVMVVLNFLNVFFRFLLPQSPFSYFEELTVIIFIWVSMFGISYGYKTYSHTVLDFFYNLMPKVGKKVTVVFSMICSVIFMAVMAYTGYFTVVNQIEFSQVTPGLKLPMVVNSGAMLAGSIISIFSILRAGQIELKKFGKTSEEVDL